MTTFQKRFDNTERLGNGKFLSSFGLSILTKLLGTCIWYVTLESRTSLSVQSSHHHVFQRTTSGYRQVVYSSKCAIIPDSKFEWFDIGRLAMMLFANVTSSADERANGSNQSQMSTKGAHVAIHGLYNDARADEQVI